MEKRNFKPIRLSDNDLEIVKELIQEIDGIDNFSSLMRHLLYTYKETIEVKKLQAEIRKLNFQHKVTRETFTIYLEYLDKAGEGIDEGKIVNEAESRVKKREAAERTRKHSKSNRYRRL